MVVKKQKLEIISLHTNNRKTVDKKALEKEHGELMQQVKKLEEQYTTIKSSSYLKVS